MPKNIISDIDYESTMYRLDQLLLLQGGFATAIVRYMHYKLKACFIHAATSISKT